MKKFAVLQKIGFFAPTVVRDFDDKDDAEVFRALMCKSEDNNSTEYFTIENLSYRDPQATLAP